ncbi:MAG: mannose-6-phosphate isomerase, class I [Ignavibacteriales bacterium]
MIIIEIPSEAIYPFTFEPIYKDYVWGGTNLSTFGKILPSDRIAESWEASCHPNGTSIIGNGLLRLKALTEVIDQYGASIVGTKMTCKKYPLLVKFIDANDKLSIQVHPGDDYARTHENGESGKNEMWYIVSAKPDSFIYYGVVEGTSKKDFEKAIKNNTVEKHLNKMYVFPGDVINIPAGTVHGLCEGITLIEIQQSSDATYRIYDYDRKNSLGKPLRELHIQKALDVINFNQNKKSKLCGIKMVEMGRGYRKILAANKYFACELWNSSGTRIQNSDPQKFFIYTLIDGNIVIYHKNGKTNVSKGESVLIPSSLGRYIFEGRYIGLKTYVPDLENDIYKPLISAGYKRKEIQDSLNQ